MKQVVVIGSSNIDLVYQVTRLPQLGETIFGNDLQRLPGGKGLNQAVAAARVCENVIFLGSFGCGSNSAFLKDFISKENIDISQLKETNTETGTAIITIVENDNTIVVIPGANNDIDIDYIKKYEYLLNDSIVVIQNEIKQETNEYIIDYCYKNEITLIYNPAPARKIDLKLLEKVSYFTPNETEASEIFESSNYNEIVKKYPRKVIITVGKEGILYYDNEVVNIAPQPTKAIDTTGAGDTLNGILAASLAENYTLHKALQRAVSGATLSIKKIGAQAGMPKKEEISDEKKWNLK
ncbi:ribokinase [Erysipelotrichaceae bacterium OttesenSCG-928-M19]|nr:ribokinase [Erysipelotrichaceae bacterium OttesenSCG-928-M19]